MTGDNVNLPLSTASPPCPPNLTVLVKDGAAAQVCGNGDKLTPSEPLVDIFSSMCNGTLRQRDDSVLMSHTVEHIPPKNPAFLTTKKETPHRLTGKTHQT